MVYEWWSLAVAVVGVLFTRRHGCVECAGSVGGGVVLTGGVRVVEGGGWQSVVAWCACYGMDQAAAS